MMQDDARALLAALDTDDWSAVREAVEQAGDVLRTQERQHDEPQHRDRPEKAADATGTKALKEKQGRQHDQRQRQNEAVQGRRSDLQPLDR